MARRYRLNRCKCVVLCVLRVWCLCSPVDAHWQTNSMLTSKYWTERPYVVIKIYIIPLKFHHHLLLLEHLVVFFFCFSLSSSVLLCTLRILVYTRSTFQWRSVYFHFKLKIRCSRIPIFFLLFVPGRPRVSPFPFRTLDFRLILSCNPIQNRCNLVASKSFYKSWIYMCVCCMCTTPRSSDRITTSLNYWLLCSRVCVCMCVAHLQSNKTLKIF